MAGGDPADKVGPSLARRIDAVDAQGQVEVIIELAGAAEPVSDGTRQQRITAAKSSFERDLAAVSDRIQAVGGTVLETAWLNRTLRGRLPASTVVRVAEDDGVAAIDLPHTIETDV